MTRKVHCVVLGEELDALTFQPYPGELGKKIFESVSQKAWQQWLAHQTMLINEHRLSPINPEHRKYLEGEMEKFFFAGGAEKPEGYVAPDAE
ncbi:MAG: oxidative damage protection protein [Xanthomonadales bacterium]|jgi:Fe-S cluster biosynthesis and repair protein YggX|nr:oxidative damage protection protein [Xanthomonadales bacterium]